MRLTDRHRQHAEDDLAVGFAKALDYVQRRVVERVRTAATTLVASAEGDNRDAAAGLVVLPLATPTAAIDPAIAYDPMWWRKGYTRYVSKRVDGLYSSTVDRAGAELGVTFDPDDPTIADALDGLDDTADLWGAGLGPFVEKQVRDGMTAGDSVDGLAARLRDSEDSWFGIARSVLLASVAVAATYNRATLAAGTSARAQGTSSTKEWAATLDERTRDTHVDMDGQSVDIGEDFLVAGAYPAAGPHDQRLPVEEVAGCRCVLILSSDGGSVADESTDVQDDGAATLDYATDGSEEDALVAGAEQFHTHGHCERCGGWLEGRSYCGKCGRGYTGPLLDAGSQTPSPAVDESADVDVSHDRLSQADTMPINEDVGLVATDGVDQEDAALMPTIFPTAASSDAITVNVTGGNGGQLADLVQRFQTTGAQLADGTIGMVPWRGVLAVEGRPTGDGRMFRQGSLRWDEGFLPTDLFAMLSDPDGGGGHDGSSICGRIDRMWKQPATDGSYTEIWGEGVYDTGTSTGAEVFRLQQNGMLTGVSIDVDSVEVVMPDIQTDEDFLDLLFGGGVEEYSAGRIRRATVCSIPAFIEARIFPVSDVGVLVASAASEDFKELRVWTPLERGAASGTLVASASAFSAKPKAKEADVFHSALVDSDPPAEVFARREYRDYTPFTVDADGRVSGHCSSWDACHIGFTDRCVLPPRSRTGYAHARTGHVLTAEGDLVATARVFAQFGPGRRGHAPEDLGPRPAVEWYENLALALADVAIYEDKDGIQIQGRMRPGATRAQVVALRASRISPDWRTINGALECVGLAVVNVSGFTNSAQAHALVASAMEAGVELPALDGARAAAWIVEGEVRTLVASPGPTRDPALALVGVVQAMAERLEALEQAELARQRDALLAGLPSEADEQAELAARMSAILDGVDLDVEAATLEAAAEDTPEVTAGLSAEELATLRAALAITERLSARPMDDSDLASGDTISCPSCHADVPADSAGGDCPVCGEPIPADAADMASGTTELAGGLVKCPDCGQLGKPGGTCSNCGADMPAQHAAETVVASSACACDGACACSSDDVATALSRKVGWLGVTGRREL